MMNKTQAQSSLKKIQTESAALEGSSLITFFEIDIGTLAQDRGIVIDSNETLYRLHNTIKLTTSDIIWKGNRYSAAPINAEGFEINSRGTIPTPKLSIIVNEAGIIPLALLKSKLNSLGDLVGAKVTRRRTYAKYIDRENFTEFNQPKDFDPDPNAELYPDVYFINRKIRENKYIIEYELASILDLEGILLPKRQVISLRCNFTYRGEGCLYEYKSLINTDIHGDAILPTAAPVIADENDEILTIKYGISGIKVSGEYRQDQSYSKGSQVYIIRDGIKYYFLAKIDVPANVNINNITYWAADKCSKCIKGCRLRWGTSGSVDTSGTTLVKGELPFGGFPAASRLASQR
jgi:lambda family phage minor tail protein L